MTFIYRKDYEELMRITYGQLSFEERKKRFELTDEFKTFICDVIIKACSEYNDFDNLPPHLNYYYIANCVHGVIIDLINKMQCLGDDLDAYDILKDIINKTPYIAQSIKQTALNILTQGFESIYNEEKYNELMNERMNNRIIIFLNEEEFTKIMEAHHRWKWGNHIPFSIEENIQTATSDTLFSVKPRYVYRDDNSEFYVNEDLIKTILCECFDEYDVENIQFNTSYVKHDWVDYTKNIRRDSHGNPADQESMRMMRHPGMYQGGTVSPTFNNIVIYARNKNLKENNEYKLVL